MSDEGQITKLLDNEDNRKVLTASQKEKRNRHNRLRLKKRKLNEAEKNLSEYQKKKNKRRSNAYRMRQAEAKKNQASIEVDIIPLPKPSVEVVQAIPTQPFEPKNKPPSKKQKVLIEKIEEIYQKSWPKPPSQTCGCTSSKTSRPSPYRQFGSASSASLLEQQFKEKYGETVSLFQLYYCENETAYNCDPSGNTFNPKPEVKVSVFYTSHPDACDKHRFMVITIIVWNAMEEETLIKMEKYLRRDYLPGRKGNKGTRANFSVCTSCPKKNCSSGDVERHPPCNCNLSPASAWNYGCATKINADVCKWNVEAKKSVGRKRFCIDGKEDDPKFKKFCDNAADKLVLIAMEHVPEALANNYKLLEPAVDCQLGGFEAPRCFAGISINADYAAHPHIDKNDYQFGTNAILSFRSEKAHPTEQKHCLPNYSVSEGGVPGVKFILKNGSVCYENSRLEIHSSTKALQPNPQNPKRIALVVYLHKSLDRKAHGQKEVTET